MNLILIGKFIAEQRKNKKLTQIKLAELLNVSEKTISKWECGKGFPDSSLIMPLCSALNITANELLSGKKLENENYIQNAEENIVSLVNEKKINKKKTIITNLMAGLILISALTIIFVASFINMANALRVVLIVISFIILFTGVILVCILDNDAGYFECKHCKNRFKPTDYEYIMATHTITTRHLKCPKCGKKSYCKRRLTK